nr:hypothetical protein HK105_001276 [Polyrhizophydium stewartii]
MLSDDLVKAVFKTGPPRQRAALTSKSIASIKRQITTTFFCAALCPFVMVGIVSVYCAWATTYFGTYGTLGLAPFTIKGQPPCVGHVICSNISASDRFNVPYWGGATVITGNSGSFSTDYPTGKLFFEPARLNDPVYIHTNWRQKPTTAEELNIFLGTWRTCEQWYTETYPLSKNSPYDRPSGAKGFLARDATYSSTPLGGWLNVLSKFNKSIKYESVLFSNEERAKFTPPNSLYVFNILQKRAWYLLGADPSVDTSLIGQRTGGNAVPLAQLAANVSANDVSPAFTPVTNASKIGLLGTIPTRYYIDFDPYSYATATTNANVTAVPWYAPVSTEDAMDDIIFDALSAARDKIGPIDKTVLSAYARDARGFFKVNAKIGAAVRDLPYGGVYFKKIDHAKRQYAYNLSIGSNDVLRNAKNFPSAGERQLLQVTQLSNAILRNSNSSLGAASITQGIRVFPRATGELFDTPYGNAKGTLLYPFGFSFLIPLFVIELVREKETRILIMMKMNGVSVTSYYFAHFLNFLATYAISAVVFLIAGVALSLKMFGGQSSVVVLLVLVLWGLSQVSLSFFLAAFFRRSRLALIIVFLLVLCSVMVAASFDNTLKSGTTFCTPYSLAAFKMDDPLTAVLVALVLQTPVLMLLASYLTAVLPSEFGVRRPWHFPITALFNGEAKARAAQADVEANIAKSISLDQDELAAEDADVKTERARVDNNQFDPKSPIVVRHMRKVYTGRSGAGPKLAVKDVTFAAEQGLVFGLLGPNGAGKATLISMLTGLYEASAGDATLAGFDIKTQTHEVYQRIGICPQFNILWAYHTVQEHLLFYARLKGIAAEDEARAVHQAIVNVALQEQWDVEVQYLSGGRRRRVGIAIALLGNPRVVFLDEPTTGLDPEVRRQIWDIVERTRNDKTIVLTTHSMEEAEALCQRVGIMAKGTLRCLSDPTSLKRNYGSGFRIHINTQRGDIQRASTFVEALLPAGWTKIDSFATNALYEFPAAGGRLSELFAAIEAGKAQHGILDWGVGQTTLEDVFVRLIGEDDAGAD